ELHALADADRSAVRLLLAGDHPEERRLAGAVRADDADDRGLRDLERQIVDQQVVAVALREMLGLDHEVSEPLSGREPDLGRVVLLLRVLGEQRVVRGEARLALRLARARRGADPLELLRDLPLARARLLLFDGEPLLLRLEP